MITLRRCVLSLGLLAITSCTQDGAPIEDFGKQYYGHEHEAALNSPGNKTYSKNSGDYDSHYKSGYTRSVESASVPSVGVSDLPPTQPQPGGNAITPSTRDSSSPFPPPSKPLDQPPGQLTNQDKAIAPNNAQVASIPGDSPKVSEKDGVSLIWPVDGGKIVAHFKGSTNDGINIALGEGEPVYAAASGTIVYAGNDLKDYGNMVVVRHDNAWITGYANASRIAVKKNSYVKQGDIIAYVGATGNVKTPQLHFTLRKGKVPIDPEKYLPKMSGQ